VAASLFIPEVVEMAGSFMLWASALATAGLVGACGQASPNSERNAMSRTASQKSQDHAALLQRLGLEIPSSATIEFAQYQRGMDDNARLILLMPAADWAAMQAEPPFDAVRPERYTAEGAVRLGPSEGAWHPADEAEIRGAQIPMDHAKYMNVGVAPAEGGRVRVYLFWFET
jgi:hypothetical protein